MTTRCSEDGLLAPQAVLAAVRIILLCRIWTWLLRIPVAIQVLAELLPRSSFHGWKTALLPPGPLPVAWDLLKA